MNRKTLGDVSISSTVQAIARNARSVLPASSTTVTEMLRQLEQMPEHVAARTLAEWESEFPTTSDSNAEESLLQAVFEFALENMYGAIDLPLTLRLYDDLRSTLERQRITAPSHPDLSRW